MTNYKTQPCWYEQGISMQKNKSEMKIAGTLGSIIPSFFNFLGVMGIMDTINKTVLYNQDEATIVGVIGSTIATGIYIAGGQFCNYKWNTLMAKGIEQHRQMYELKKEYTTQVNKKNITKLRELESEFDFLPMWGKRHIKNYKEKRSEQYTLNFEDEK